MEDELVNSTQLAFLQQQQSDEKLRQYLEENVIPLVLKKIKYAQYSPKFKIFLSHKSKDKPLMRTFKSGLKFLGYRTWIDEDDMPMGADLVPALKAAIDKCDCLIAWLTPDYFKSEYCEAELLYAKECRKIIIPFGVYSQIKENFTGDLEFLKDKLVFNPQEKTFLEILRRIDSTLFNFEEMPMEP